MSRDEVFKAFRKKVETLEKLKSCLTDSETLEI